MGMFDSMYDAQNHEWQTKAFGCVLDRFREGDPVPHPNGVAWPSPPAYQVKVYGGPRFTEPARGDAFATIADGVLTAIPAERHEHLPLVDYHGGWAVEPTKD